MLDVLLSEFRVIPKALNIYIRLLNFIEYVELILTDLKLFQSRLFDGGKENIGKIVKVEINSSNQNSLFGTIKEKLNEKVA